jgi:hypothetical protein
MAKQLGKGNQMMMTWDHSELTYWYMHNNREEDCYHFMWWCL